MARLVTYQPGAVQREGATAAKFQAADFSTSVLGEGLQRAGAAISDFAEKQDQIEALYDHQDAQRLDLEHVEQTRLLSQQLRQARGSGARAEAQRLQAELDTYNRDLLAQARSPRARTALQDSIARRSATEIDRYHAYADQEFEQEFRATSDARIPALTEAARDIEDEAEAVASFSQVRAAVADRARFENWEGGADGPIARGILLRQSSEFYIGRAQAIARAGDPQRAIQYARDRAAEITGDQLDAFVGGLTEEAREQRMEQWLDSGAVASIPEQQRPARANARSRWTVISRPGAPRDGGARIHQGYDIAPVGNERGWYPDQDFRIANPRNGRRQGLTVDVILADGTQLTLMHLRELPRVGQYRAGELAAIAGNTGNARTTPAHFHVEGRRNGARIDPTVYFGAGSGGQAVAEASGSNLEAQLAQVRAAGLSYRDRQAAERVVRRRHGERMAARDASEEEAGRNVDRWMVENADTFTSTAQIPGFTGLSPSRQAQLAERARRNREGDGTTITPEMAFEYNYMRYANPRTFASPEYLRRLQAQGAPQSLQRQWGADAGSMQGQSATQRAEQITDSRIWSIARPIFEEIGLRLDTVEESGRGPTGRARQQAERLVDIRRKNMALVRLRELSQIWAQTNRGQVPDDATIRGWVGNILQRGAEGQSFNFEADDQAQYQRMNPAERQLLEGQLRSRGVPTTPENVVRLYRYRMALYSRRRG